MKALLEVEFDPEKMIDEATLKEQYGGSWLKFMQYMWKEEGVGIFENDVNLVDVLW